ncbi:MAG TPA: AraC family transcriptional regulator [Anaerolineales bacterium]|nr:AraC family transcriptional regulator [Anaerolineales bacterium]
MKQTKEWSNIKHNTHLDVGFLHARYIHYAYPRHSHDYYVISLIERGRQSFTHKGERYTTPAGGVILINPGVVHTGEPVDEQGFELRSLYPTLAHMKMAAFELTGRHVALPFFNDIRVDHPWVSESILSLHRSLMEGSTSLETESRFVWFLTQLIKFYGETSLGEQKAGDENQAIRKARHFIEEHFAHSIRLDALARHVALSPYYFLRVFCAQVGMPPHAYQESVRIRHAQRLIREGKTLAETAMEVGFSSQSHMTRSFKKIIGVTPGQYAQDL